MARKNSHVIAEWKKFLADPAEQKVDISAGQVPASDAARKKHIATDEQLVLPGEKTKTAGTMAGDFEHLKFRAKKISGRCFFDEEVRFSRLDFQLETKVPEKLAVGNHRRGFRMATNLTAEPFFDRRNVLNMIDVPVRQQQQFKVDIARADPVAGALRCVEQDPAFGRGPEVAVRFEYATAKRLVSHWIDSK